MKFLYHYLIFFHCHKTIFYFLFLLETLRKHFFALIGLQKPTITKNSPHWGVADAVWRGGLCIQTYKVFLKPYRFTEHRPLHQPLCSINIPSLRDLSAAEFQNSHHWRVADAVWRGGLCTQTSAPLFSSSRRGIGMGLKPEMPHSFQRTDILMKTLKVCTFKVFKMPCYLPGVWCYSE